jgi:hypothetical protein
MSDTKMTETKMRTCKKCGIEKKLNTDNFYKNGITKKNEMKFKGSCKACFIKISYIAVMDKTAEQRLKHNKKSTDLYHKDIEKARKYKRDYYAKKKQAKLE